MENSFLEACCKTSEIFVLRLLPEQDLKKSLLDFVSKKNLKASLVLTTVGSLRKAHLRFAGENQGAVVEGPLEIVSLVGTLSQEGLHLHLSVSDASGKVFGGHLLDGSLIHTTAEIVLMGLPGLKFSRSQDEKTGYKELKILKT